MNRLEKFMKAEIEAEVVACTHIVVMIFTYAAEKCLAGNGLVSFWTILQMSILGYGFSWFQRMLFRKEKLYTRKEYLCRVICWWAAPSIVTVVSGILLKWFEGLHIGFALFFYGLMLVYYIVFWIILQHFYREESQSLNEWLRDFKHGGEEM